MASNYSLDVDQPDKVIRVLEYAADQYYAAAAELESAHQDEAAGKPWDVIAAELEQAADRIQTRLRPLGW